jgi:hypothetical protein
MLKTLYSFGQGVILGQAEEFKAFVEKSGIPAAWTRSFRITNRASFKCRHVRNAWKRTQRIDQ